MVIELREHDCAKALVAAVVIRACDDLKLGRVLAAHALEWLNERGPTDAWSFEWCCGILNLDPDAVRQQLADDLADRPQRRLRAVLVQNGEWRNPRPGIRHSPFCIGPSGSGA